MKINYAKPDEREGGWLRLLEPDGTVVKEYLCIERSWRRIEHRKRMFRLNGRDEKTGDWIYLPEAP